MAEDRAVTMSAAMDFHSQVASIMEVLANAAVAEICKVVDDGYAVVELEMSKSQKENEFLRRKIKLLELQIARYKAERVRGADGSIYSRFHGVRLLNRQNRDSLSGPSLQARTRFLNRGRGSQPCVQKNPPINLDQDPDQEVVTTTKTESAEQQEEEVEGELLIIKVEGAVESTGNVNEALHDTGISTGAGADPTPLFHAACEGPPTGCSTVMEVSGSDILPFVSKTPEGHTAGSLLLAGSDITAGECQPLNSHSDPMPTPYDCVTDTPKSSPPEVIVIDGGGVSDREGERFEWPHVDQTNREAGRWRPDQRALPMMQLSGPESLRHRSRQARPILPHDAAPGPSSSLKSSADAPGGAALRPAPAPAPAHAGPNISSRQPPSFNAIPKHRPYGCSSCAKRFFLESELRRHMSRHTKERAFRCKLCHKSFVCQSQLDVHQNVHTGERPFSCSICHRGFSHPSNLSRHQKRTHSQTT